METGPGKGAPGWGRLRGMLLDGDEPYICPEHLKEVAEFIHPSKVAE